MIYHSQPFPMDIGMPSRLRINKKPEDLPILRLEIIPTRTRRITYEPQPPPQDNPLVLQLAPDPYEENLEICFFDFFSLQ
jgi:hypothetical protein